MIRSVALVLAWAAPVAALAAQGRPDPPIEAGRLRQVEVFTRDVFTEDEAAGNVLFWLANSLHVPTRRAVVERELWLEPGDAITLSIVDEIERNLRSFGLFGEVDAWLERVPDSPDEVDLFVDTRDRFSLTAAGGFSFVGGVSEFSATLGESNLFGTGKRVFASIDDADDERTTSFSYSDPQLFGSWHTLSVRGGETEEGSFGSLRIERPFQHLQDPSTYGGGVGYDDSRIDYFLRGDTVAEIPRETVSTDVFAITATGPRESRAGVGFDASWFDTDYEPAVGALASRYRVPGDTVGARARFAMNWTEIHEFQKRRGLDAIDFEEDLWLGTFLDVRPGLLWRDEEGEGGELQPLLDTQLRAAVSPGRDTYLTFDVETSVRGFERVEGWGVGAAVHAFNLSLPQQTLAASFSARAADEEQGLEPQFTLAEDNGLRGYPAREFAGDRILRLNLENRIDTGLELWSIHLGVVPFADVGWVHGPDQGLSLADPIASVGAGLRIGSSNFLGRGVLRIDVGVPLSTVDGESYDPSISIASGQVFSYFGNANELRVEF